MKEEEDSSSNGSNISNITPSKEAEDSSQMYQISSLWRKQKTLPQKFKHIKHHTYGGGKRFLPNGPKYTKANPQ